jgi:dienelactone hydrolase
MKNIGTLLMFNIISLATFFVAVYAVPAQAQQEVTLPSLDGTVLKATWFAPTSIPTASSAAQPPNSIAPRPVVIALHGCGGLYATTGARKGLLNARHQAMGEMLAGEGYHVVFPDSLTARGERSICVQPMGTRRITQQQRRVDALGALTWVRQQPWADSQQVAVLGWSHGGSAVLAATDATHSEVKRHTQANALAPFKIALAFYPGCSDSLRLGYQPNTALTFFLGADDDWTPPEPCIALAQRLQAQQTGAKPRVELNVYPGAVHDFDTPLPGVRERAEIPSRIHVGKGVMAGQNPAARAQSWDRVRQLLGEAFR